jgi:FAD:protein FMN transferase
MPTARPAFRSSPEPPVGDPPAGLDAPRARPAWEFQATGTRWRLYHSGGLGEREAASVAASVEADEARWSRFRPDSETSRLNAAAGEWVAVAEATLELLVACARWTSSTDGVFQPLIGATLSAWGYADSIAERAPGSRQTPPPAPVAGSVEVEVDLERGRARLPRGLALDLGGIGKAWIAARVAPALAGLTEDPSLLIDAGGDLLAVRGEHVVAVETPAGGGAQVDATGDGVSGAPAWVGLSTGQAIATSGCDRRSWVNGDGAGAHHLIDPATGAPGPRAHATVIADDAVTADVLAKTLALRPERIARCPWPARLTIASRTVTRGAWPTRST